MNQPATPAPIYARATPETRIVHVGRWILVRTPRRCETEYRCELCGATFTVDSSD